MHFRFDVSMTEDDYFEYNLFTSLKTEQGKKNLRSFRICLCTVCVVALLLFCDYEVAGNIVTTVVIGIPLLIGLWFVLKPVYRQIIRNQINASLKNNKRLYTPQAVLEFYDEWIAETAPDEVTQIRYNVIDRICVSEKGAVYMYLNGMRAYTIPWQTFHSKEEFDCFIAFMHTRCSNIKFYN